MAPARKTSPAAGPVQLELTGLLAAPGPSGAGRTPLPPEAAATIEPSALDHQFARLMVRLHAGATGQHPTLEAAAMLASAWRAGGHSCAPLDPTLRDALLATAVIGEPGAERPLILDEQNRLYLQRYWRYEHELAEAISARLAATAPALDVALLEADLARLLPTETPDRQAGQRDAVRTALTSRFAVITGGPGTGKTRTVGLVLALLASQAAAAGQRAPRLRLAAPTGKAALRLTESIAGVLRQLGVTGLAIPEATTLHRLLGLGLENATPRWHGRNPLPAEAVIIDEASMVDLPMMAKIFAAVPASARLILLGDRDQLASVETGHVLGDICAAGVTGPLSRHLCELTENFRFQRGSAIHALSLAIRAGDALTAQALLEAGSAEVTGHLLPAPSALLPALEARLIAGFRPTLVAASPAEALAALSQFRLLCAVRGGPTGLDNLNRLSETALARAGLITPTSRHYAGRVIMIQRNDYGLRLFNGDIGLLRTDDRGELRAWFRGEDGRPRELSPARLPEHETAWAMTVHKCQGSEFERILLILPAQDTPVVTRELIYTAVTRAKAGVEIWHEPGLWPTAIQRSTVRMGGLQDRLR